MSVLIPSRRVRDSDGLWRVLLSAAWCALAVLGPVLGDTTPCVYSSAPASTSGCTQVPNCTAACGGSDLCITGATCSNGWSNATYHCCPTAAVSPQCLAVQYCGIPFNASNSSDTGSGSSTTAGDPQFCNSPWCQAMTGNATRCFCSNLTDSTTTALTTSSAVPTTTTTAASTTTSPPASTAAMPTTTTPPLSTTDYAYVTSSSIPASSGASDATANLIVTGSGQTEQATQFFTSNAPTTPRPSTASSPSIPPQPTTLAMAPSTDTPTPPITTAYRTTIASKQPTATCYTVYGFVYDPSQWTPTIVTIPVVSASEAKSDPMFLPRLATLLCVQVAALNVTYDAANNTINLRFDCVTAGGCNPVSAMQLLLYLYDNYSGELQALGIQFTTPPQPTANPIRDTNAPGYIAIFAVGSALIVGGAVVGIALFVRSRPTDHRKVEPTPAVYVADHARLSFPSHQQIPQDSQRPPFPPPPAAGSGPALRLSSLSPEEGSIQSGGQPWRGDGEYRALSSSVPMPAPPPPPPAEGTRPTGGAPDDGEHFTLASLRDSLGGGSASSAASEDLMLRPEDELFGPQPRTSLYRDAALGVPPPSSPNVPVARATSFSRHARSMASTRLLGEGSAHPRYETV